ncbi:DUF448 domain-containing protein [Aurantiacibacter poecillastricola]|uniref:DUF448 domain-containing protein n=1 Tax=Aurantiacibacter poecillastricola TaxID=3064385 RepID=UPI00273DC679|nr:DUF448 domain-containing protein [Aurantiacibacter sp. 219JJ12-13]MDP5262990.1 DUF448 domain-containing protein [Aurantiacibacter sp. 219JJ12-13]
MRNPRNDTLGSPKTGSGVIPASGSERRCVLTGETSARDDLVRLAVSPDGPDGTAYVLPDALAKAPGRGAWIGVSKAELADAMASGRLKAALARAFKTGGLSIPEDLPARTETALKKAVLDRLGLEMRSGRLILGSDRIANEARMGAVAALYHAADAKEDGCRKLDQAWRVGLDEEGSGLAGVRLPLDREALSVALGRENVVHLALADAKSAQRVAIPLGRLQTFLGATETVAET